MAYVNILQKVLFVMSALLWGTHVYAAPTVTGTKQEPVQIKLEQFKIGNDNGKETLVVAKDAKPGEVIEYRATYKNVSNGSVRNLVATLPIPKGTEYQAKTANPVSGVEASIDNITFATVPLMDSTKKQEISPKLYRALRWKVSTLKANEAIVVSARVKVGQE